VHFHHEVGCYRGFDVGAINHETAVLAIAKKDAGVVLV